MGTSQMLGEDIDSWETMMFLYNSALKEVGTKLEILNDEFVHIHKYNPIEYIKSRIKAPESIVKKLKHNLQTADDMLWTFQHHTVVTGQVRFTLCTVHDNVINSIRILRHQLHMCRESCTSQTYDTGSLYCIDDLSLGHLGVITVLSQTFYRGVVSVIFYNNRRYFLLLVSQKCTETC